MKSEAKGLQALPAFLALLLLAVSLVIYRLWVIGVADLTLDVEETYYLYWSAHPDLGYYSKPPMVAWLLALSTSALGTTVWGIKLVSLLLHTLTGLIIYSLGRRLYSPTVGLMAALVFLTLPIMGMMSLYTTTDAPLHFFWALTLRLFVEARDRQRLVWWLATGIAAGLGLMSKYTMGMLAIGLLVYLLLDRQQRRLLINPGLWLGAATAALVWLPNLYWNAEHGFIAFRHTAEISQLDRDLFHLDKLAEFLLPQLLIFGPVFFFVLLMLLFRPAKREGSNDSLLLWTSVPALAIISLQALLAEANLNWASPAYVGASLLVAAFLTRHSWRWLIFGLVFNSSLLVGAYHYHAIAGMMGVELSRNSTPYRKRLGWRELGEQVRPYRQQYPDAVLLSDSRGLLALMGYYSGEWPPQVASWNPTGVIKSQYDLTVDISKSTEQTFLFLSHKPLDVEVLARFQRQSYLGMTQHQVYPDLARSVHLYLLQGFKGYR